MVLVVNVAIITSVLGTARPAGTSCSNINHNEVIRHSLGGQWNLLTNANLEMQAEKALNTASSGQALSWYPHVVNDIGVVYRSSAVCLTSFPLLGFELKIQGKEMQAQSSRTSIQKPLLSLSPSTYPSPFQSLPCFLSFHFFLFLSPSSSSPRTKFALQGICKVQVNRDTHRAMFELHFQQDFGKRFHTPALDTQL